jgi:TRAP-type transport system periplasmic protein
VLPFLYRSYAEVDAVRARVDPQIIAGMRKQGYVSYGIGEAGFAYLMSNQPVRQIDDLQGRKVWVPEGDRISLAAFEAVGVAPIQLPITDVLTALQTGVIDTLGTTPTAAIALQWHTRLRYLTDLPLLYTYGTFLIQEKALKRVSEQDRAVLREVLEHRLREIERQTREDNREALAVLEQQGIQVLAPSAAELADWQQAVVAATDRLASEEVFSQQILDLLRQTLREFRAQ